MGASLQHTIKWGWPAPLHWALAELSEASTHPGEPAGCPQYEVVGFDPGDDCGGAFEPEGELSAAAGGASDVLEVSAGAPLPVDADLSSLAGAGVCEPSLDPPHAARVKNTTAAATERAGWRLLMIEVYA